MINSNIINSLFITITLSSKITLHVIETAR